MSWLTRVLGQDAGASPPPRSPVDEFWFSPIGRRTAAGVAVTIETALKAPVVLDCLTVLSQTVASLPFGVFERRGRDKRRVDRHPLMALLEAPDGECTTHEFWAQMVWDLAAAGNAIYETTTDGGGRVLALRRHEPDRVQVERLADGTRRWLVSEATGQQRRLVEGEVWHLRDLPLINGLVGTSRIAAGAEAIGALLALQEYGASYFENDATPPIVIKHPGHFRDQASRDNFLAAIKSWFGRKRTTPAVLEYDMAVEKLGTTPEEAQFLETRKELQAEIARIWRMPPHKVGILERATFSNIEHQALEFVTDTLAPWLSLIEDAVNRALVLDRRRFFFEFNVNGLLRGDIRARFESYAQARQWGWMSVNEIRRLENMNSIGRAGDQFMAPLNMAPAGAGPEAVLGPAGEIVSVRELGQWRRAGDGA